MNKYLLFLLVIAGNFAVIAQDLPNFISAKEVSTITYWEAGYQFKYKKTEENYRTKNGKRKPKYDELHRSDVTLTVKAQSDSSYLMVMSYSNSQLKDEEQDFIGEVVEVLKIQYVTDEIGAFDSIVNTKELVEIALSKLDMISAKSDLDENWMRKKRSRLLS